MFDRLHTRRLLLAVSMIAMTGGIGVTVAPALAEDVCSDQYMTNAIQNEAAAAQNATGLCPTAKAAVALYAKGIKLVSRCQHIESLRSYKAELEYLLLQAKQQQEATCS